MTQIKYQRTISQLFNNFIYAIIECLSASNKPHRIKIALYRTIFLQLLRERHRY